MRVQESCCPEAALQVSCDGDRELTVRVDDPVSFKVARAKPTGFVGTGNHTVHGTSSGGQRMVSHKDGSDGGDS